MGMYLAPPAGRKGEWEEDGLTCTKFCWAHSLYMLAHAAFRASRQSRSYGLHGGMSNVPMCCEPKVIRLRIGGLLCRSMYARKNCPPGGVVGPVPGCASIISNSSDVRICGGKMFKRVSGVPWENPIGSKSRDNWGKSFSCWATSSTCSSILPNCSVSRRQKHGG